MKKLLFPIIFGISLTTLFAQTERDSTDYGLDSLLERNVKRMEFVQSASKYSQVVYESPNSLSLVSRNTIDNYGYSTLSEALTNSNVIFINNDLNYQYVGFLGMGKPTDNNNRVQMLLDGHRLNDYVYNAIPVDELALDIHMYNKIEVIKGPGSVLYGAGAMFGVINLIPSKDSKVIDPRFRVELGSYNTRSFSGMWNYNSGGGFNFSIHGFYYKSRGRDYYFPEYDTEETNNGIISGMDDENKHGFYASVKYGKFELFGITSYRYKEIPTASYGVDFGSLEATTDIYNFWEARYNTELDYNKQLSLRLFYDQYKYSGVYVYDELPTWDANDSKSLGAEIKFLWDPFHSDRVIIGAELNNAYKVQYKYWSDEQLYSFFEKPVKAFSLFFQNEYEINKDLIFYLASRYDAFSNSESKLSPRATVVYSLNDQNTVRVLAGSSYRIPASYEKYFEDEIGGYKKNESLNSEKITTYALYWDYRVNGNLRLDINIFKNNISSFIEVVMDPEDSLSYYTNNGNLKAFGFGADVVADFDENFGGYLSYQHQNSSYENGTKLTATPDNLLKFGIYLKPLRYFGFGFEYRYESKKPNSFYMESPEIHYASLNVFNPQKIFGMNFSFTIRNLFNYNIQNPGNFQNIVSSFKMPERNYLISIGYGF